ncbi:MAG: hypothetical protein LBS32_00730 [Clostridiales Family XIII bacterium]|jgi:hypothetical protein|nr:hypothetical protein [Clostridiales Family XIII bacterium]
MKLTEAQTKKLLDYGGQPQLKQLALNMALTRLKGIYKTNPTPDVVARCTSDLNAIFEKFALIMQSDYEWIISLK